MQFDMAPMPARVANVAPAARPIVRAAIETIRDVAPDSADEVEYEMDAPRSTRMMWKLVRYRAGGENVLGVGTFADHSTMFFYRGRELDAGKGVLQGSGKDTRFVTLRSAADAKSVAIRKLIREAFRLAAR
jgi:hypothetical protein